MMKVWRRWAGFTVVCGALCGAFASAARANDSSIEGYGGRWKVLTGENRTIRMVSERVAMDVFANDYKVRAEFVFRNDGAARSVMMGFPEQGYGDVSGAGKQSAFKNFVTTVDGQPTKAYRAKVKMDEDEESLLTYWIKTVRFGGHQTRHIMVSYRAPLGGSVARGIETFAMYAFTGGNWKGEVEQSDLTVRLRAPGNWAVSATLGDYPLEMTRQGATFTRTFRHWQAQSDFHIGFTRVPAGWLWDGQSDGPFGETPGVQTVNVPGQVSLNPNAFNPEYDPPALWQNGRAWLRLSALNDRLAEVYPATKKPDGSEELRVYQTGNAKTGEAILQTPIADVTFLAGRSSMRVQDAKTKRVRTVSLPAAPWVFHSVRGGSLYVPASVVSLWNGQFTAMPAQHRFRLAFPHPPR